MKDSLQHLIQEAQDLGAAEALALSRGQPVVAGMLGESRRLVLARILRVFPEKCTYQQEQIEVRGEGVIGKLTTTEALLLGVDRDG